MLDVKTRPLIAGVIVVAAMMGLFTWFQVSVERRNEQIDEVSIKQRAQLFQLVAALTTRIESLESTIAHDHAAYANRGIVQIEVLNRAIERKWFTPEQVRLLREVVTQADYPIDK